MVGALLAAPVTGMDEDGRSKQRPYMDPEVSPAFGAIIQPGDTCLESL